MIIVPDSNVVISALINGNGKEFALLTNAPGSIQFVVPSLLVEEVKSKISKISSLTRNSQTEISGGLDILMSSLTILHEKELDNKIVNEAMTLAMSVDIKDTLFVAVTIHTGGILWTGDLKLLRALRKQHFNQVITTKELEQIISGL
jgi:predicted nucleic acid-binding protein